MRCSHEEGTYFFNGCRKRRFCNFSRPARLRRLLHLPRHHRVPCVVLRSTTLVTSRRVQDTRASSNTRRLVPRCVSTARPGLAPVSRLDRRRARALVGAPRFPSEKPCRMRGSHAASSLGRAGRGRSNGGDARDRRAARASLFPNHRRASDLPPASPPPIADVPRALPVQRPATKAQNRPSWACPPEASTRPRCGPPRAAGSRTRSTGRGTRCSGSRSWAWRAPPSSTTAGRWSRGRSRPPAGSPARGGAPTSLREAPRSEEVNARAQIVKKKT
jgi:hypothetical protein